MQKEYADQHVYLGLQTTTSAIFSINRPLMSSNLLITYCNSIEQSWAFFHILSEPKTSNPKT